MSLDDPKTNAIKNACVFVSCLREVPSKNKTPQKDLCSDLENSSQPGWKWQMKA